MYQPVLDKSVVVTGGSHGIGKGIARVFAENGARVVIVGRDPIVGRDAADEINSCGGDVSFFQADVTTMRGCQAAADEALRRNGGIDVLCANAGIYPEKPLRDISEDDLDHVLSVNLKSSFYSVQACLELLTASSNGRIILTSSITGPITGYLGSTHYGASKAGQLGFMRSAALELASKGITVNAIVPGLIFTERHLSVDDEVITALSATIPVGRLGSVEDVGYAAMFLASNEAGFITGQSLVVDGGHTVRETI